MTLILSLKLLRDCELRIWTGIEFHNLGAVYEYDISNKERYGVGIKKMEKKDESVE